MANMYRSVLAGGGGVQPTGDAVAADVLSGKTFSNANAVGISGTMPNNGAVSVNLIAGQTYTVPEGYHNGSGTVTAPSAGLLVNNGDYIDSSGAGVIIGTYDGTTPIGPGSGTDTHSVLVNVTNYTTASCSSSWALQAYGIKNGVATSITPSGQSANISAYDYFEFTAANRQMSFS